MKNLVASFKKIVSGQGNRRAERLASRKNRVSSTSDRRRENMAKALDITIQTIDAVNELVPIDIAKNIFTGISSILVHLQNSMRNKEDLKGLFRNCEDICSILALTTKDVSIDKISEALRNALDALQLSINDLQFRVEDALRRGLLRKFFAANLDAREITAWTLELDRVFISFSARLNIVSVIRLEQIYELLQKTDTPNWIPEPPPPAPAIFFGREELLDKIKDTLLRDEDVAMIGPGGIGKSTLAMALINEETIIQKYRRRFFVTYDDANPETITFNSFLDRIAKALGLPMSGEANESQIKSNLALSPVLLVLDNAETFEEAANRDEATRISLFIAYIANTRGVTVMLTSRTSGSARRVSWIQFDVPPLEKAPARLSFRKIYHGKISDREIDELLATVDFHPLSISILAYTAKENLWSRKVLLDRWNSHRSELLQTGDWKDNLAFSIGLSLESPSVKAFGADALRVLRIVAFFPQGINQTHLTRLFPSIPCISSIMDTLCRVSLVYISYTGNSATFLKTLAPIRLFLETSSITYLELLKDIRSMCYQTLEKISREKDSYVDLLVSDHLNIEHLIVSDIAHPPFDMRVITSACRGFLLGLMWHKPRPTSLGPIVLSLSQETDVEKDSKVQCLDALGSLCYELSNFRSAGEMYLAASTLLVTLGKHSEAALSLSDAAVAYNTLGYFSMAYQLLDDFIHTISWQHINEQGKTAVYFALDWSRLHSSAEGTESLFVRSKGDGLRALQSRVFYWQARMCHGHSTPDEVETQVESLRSECMSSSGLWDRWTFLEALAEAAFLKSDIDLAIRHLNDAEKAVEGNFSLTMSILTYQAAVISVKGDYEQVRSLSKRCIDALGVVAVPTSTDFLRILYVQGRNELYAGDYSMARQIFTDAITRCDNYGEIDTKAFCLRGLGEARLLIGNQMDSNRYFAETVRLCMEGGVPPELLGVCEPIMKLDDKKFPGWRRFLAANTGYRSGSQTA